MNQLVTMLGVIKAIWLDGATLPDQFQYDNTWGVKQPLDNVWNDPATGNGQLNDKVDGTISSGINPINWNYRNNVNSPSPFNPLDGGMISQGQIIVAIPINPGLVACDDYTNRESREEKFGETVRDNLEFDEYETELIYQAKMDAYKAMVDDNDLIYQNDTADYVFEQFYQTMESSNIGLFTQVGELAVDTSSLYSASGINEAIVDTNSIEYYQKTVNDLYLNKYIQGIPLSSTDTMILENTALSNIFTTGEALHVAAAMLGKEVHPAYAAMRKSNAINEISNKLKKQSYLMAMPNPAGEFVAISGPTENIQRILLLSVEGRPIKQFDAALSHLKLQDVAAGQYLLKIINKNGIVQYLRMGIVK